MIKVENLSKKFAGTTAVEGISFRVKRGEVVGFLGPNGAGKTTTMRVLSGYLPATAGEVLIDDIPVASNPLEVRRRIGYLPENSPLYPDMRVDEYLRYRAILKGVPRSEVNSRVAEVKGLCGLADSGRRIIRQLSKGYCQRVGLADVLVHDPPLIILDEPTIGLDPNQIRQVRELIKGLARKHTVLISTHILSEAEMVCSRVLIIDQGRIIAQDTPDNLRGVLYGGITFTAELKAARDAVERALKGMDGIESFEIHALGEWLRVTVNCTSDIDARSDLFALAAGRGWGLRELHLRSKSLEDIFVSLTHKGVEE